VAGALAALGRRPDWVDDQDLVFIGVAGGYLAVVHAGWSADANLKSEG
jgi:hypothetical protein